MAEATSYPQQRSWSDIPPDLAGLVLRRLPAKVDRVRFAAVFVDITFHQGRLYALDAHKDGLFFVDISIDRSTGGPWVSRIRRVINSIPGVSGVGIPGTSGLVITTSFVSIKALHLVELHDRLLIVQRTVYGRLKMERGGVVTTGQNEFEVFEADMDGSKWTKVTTIGDDQVLFVRRLCSKSVCISQYEMPGDRIIFFENDDDDIHWNNEELEFLLSVLHER